MAGLLALGVIGAVAPPPFELLPLVVGGAIGAIVTPDFDIDHKTITEHAMLAIPVFGWLFMQSWYGYALLMRHRGWSHNFFVGTITRAIWLFVIIEFWYTFYYGVLTRFTDATPIPMNWMMDWVFAAQVYLAWWLQDIIHYLLDL